MKIHIATLFDKNYVVRTVAFYEALAKLGEYTFWFLCLDNDSKVLLEKLALPNVVLKTLDDLSDTELMATKSDRSVGEFAFTAKSVFVNYVANKTPNGEALIFADNDVIFFLPPDNLLEEMREGNYSIGITLHRFPKDKDYMNDRVGKYNAGLLFFILDPDSRACISDWRRDCIDWCYLKYEEERFGDQKYIMKWPKNYKGVYVILNKGVNTGSWNLFNWNVTKQGEQFFIDQDPLECYHFHRVKFYADGKEVKMLPIYFYHQELYKIYEEQIGKAWQKILEVDLDWNYGFVEKPNIFRIIKQRITSFLTRHRKQSSE